MSKKILMWVLVAVIGGGGTIGGTVAYAKSHNPTTQVSVQSFKVEKAKHNIGDFKKGTKYCNVQVKHKKTNVAVWIPSPAETCKILSKGQVLKVKSDKIVTDLTKKK